MATFGRREARWLPYWENGDVVKTNDPKVKVSVYTRAGRGAMLVVSNLGSAAQEVEATLVPARLGLSAGPRHAVDALTGAPIATRGTTLRLRLAPMEWRLVRVSGGGD
jgi:hypothetical protein